MNQDAKTLNCPICEGNIVMKHQMNGNLPWVFQMECERCGKFKISDLYIEDKNPPWRDVRHLVSAWIQRQNKAGQIPTIDEGEDISAMLLPEWADQFKHMGFPQSINEKLDALLLSYAEIIDGNLQGNILPIAPRIISEIAAKNIEEVIGLTTILGELGYVHSIPSTESPPYSYISAKGWQRIDELRKTVIANDSAFIAMWFDDTTKKYRDAAIAAIEYCSYKAVVVDQQEYNDFIMNQVISLIRQARFLVADFTSRPEVESDGKVKNGIRGGVYWEAGMAYGLGKPVIHTCEDHPESRSRIHFDVNQYNTIFWKDNQLSIDIRPLDQSITDPNFAEKLATRILATVGKGSYQGDTI